MLACLLAAKELLDCLDALRERAGLPFGDSTYRVSSVSISPEMARTEGNVISISQETTSTTGTPASAKRAKRVEAHLQPGLSNDVHALTLPGGMKPSDGCQKAVSRTLIALPAAAN